MAELPTQTFSYMVQRQAVAIQARCRHLVDFSVGSLLRAIAESNAGIGLWLQGVAVKVLLATRASTSIGDDLDTFVGDYGLSRLGARGAVGSVTFSRFTASAQAVIPIGARVRTSDGAQEFAVVADVTNTSYNAGLGGYVLPAGVPSIDVPVQAVTPGSGGNAIAGFVTLITSSIPYVDTVTNTFDITGGADQETDAALRLRFQRFIASLSKATPAAIGYAITSRWLGMEYTLTENYARDGSWKPGFFFVVVDDGSGDPPDSVISEIYAAIDEVRPASVTFAVHRPFIRIVDVSMTLTVAAGYDANTVKAAVGTAVRAYIEAAPLGAGLPYSKVAQIAYEASLGVTNVSQLLVNAGTDDVPDDTRYTMRAGTVSVN